MKENLLIKWKKERFLFLIPPLIVAAVMLMVYFLKGIYPFGDMTVVYGDMNQHCIPFSYHIYDVFYNGKSLFWDPYLGTGSNIFGIEALSGMFSPISWLVIFTSRANIPYFASFLLLLRMALMSVTSYVFMKKVFRDTSAFWHVSLSLMYAFCGYVLIFYTNMSWVDCAILFPLLLLALKNLYDRGRVLGYLCVLSANLIVSYYISFMVLVFLFFSSGVILFFYVEKTRRRKAMLHLGLGTIGALLLTAFVTVPAFLQSTGSGRFNGFSYQSIIATNANSSVTLNKADFFFFAAVTLVILVKIFLKARYNKRGAAIFGLLLALTVSQVFVEAINMLWYGGSYVCYPFRFGFIPLFLLLTACAWYFSPGFQMGKSTIQPAADNPDDGQSAEGIPLIRHIGAEESGRRYPSLFGVLSAFKPLPFLYAGIAIGAFATAVYYGVVYIGDMINRTLYGYWGIEEETSLFFLVTALLFALVIWILLGIKKTKIRYFLLAVVFLTEILMHSIWYVGVPPRTSGHVDDWTVVANELYEDVKADNGSISRYKDADSVMNANYPLVTGTQAVSSYLHLITSGQQDSFDSLGYSTNYTRILDTGGTLFSDMVLNVDRFLTTEEYSQDIFEQLGQSGEIYLYQNRYILPDGIVFQKPAESASSESGLDLQSGGSPLVNQNFVYRTLFQQTDDMITLVESEPELINTQMSRSGEDLTCSLADPGQFGGMIYTIPVNGQNYLYLSTSAIVGTVQILVNNVILQIPTFGDIGNVSYPASYNNCIIPLGLFEDETVTIEIVVSGHVTFSSLALGLLPVDKIAALSASTLALSDDSTSSSCPGVKIDGNSISAEAFAAKDGQSLFLPINYDEGWECTINGKSVEVDKIFGTFIMLDLVKGQNEIELRFLPKGYRIAALASGGAFLLFLLVMAVILALRRKKTASRFLQAGIVCAMADRLTDAAYILYWAVYFVAILFVYIIPTLSFIVRNLLKLFR